MNNSLPKLPERNAQSHKGDYGRVLIVGGSRGMAGAPALAGIAALRGGAGLVTVAVPAGVQATAAAFEPSLMTLGIGERDSDFFVQDDFDPVLESAQGCDAVALGPGVGRAPQTARFVHRLYRRVACPMVVDADALNALAENPELLRSPGGPRILTPHPGEFRRLTGTDAGEDQATRSESATRLAAEDPTGQTVVVLKGHETVVSDGAQCWVNYTGNPGMATGGSGDCLTGLVVALLGQGLSPADAALLAVHVHGLAGDLAAAELGEPSLIASDLPRYFGAAFRRCGSDPGTAADG